MKKLATVLLASALMIGAFSGCTTIPSTDRMRVTAMAIGYSVGIIANRQEMTVAAHDEVVRIVNEARAVIPTSEQTVTDVWVPMAHKKVEKLKVEGKITELEGVSIERGVLLVSKGVDYVFARHPQAKEMQELVNVAVEGLTDGFLAVFKPSNVLADGAEAHIMSTADVEAYNYLSNGAVIK